MLLSQLVDDFSGHYQRFFVGQSNGLSSFYGVNGRFQSGISNHGSKYHIYSFQFCYLSNRIIPGKNFNRLICQRRFELKIMFFIGNGHHIRLKFTGLLYKQVKAVIRRQRYHLKAVRICLYDFQCLPPD